MTAPRSPGQDAPPDDDTPTPPSGLPAPPRRRRTGAVVGLVMLGLVVVAVAVTALLAFAVGPRFARYDVLDPRAVERGVAAVVTDDWRRGITDVRCPGDQRVTPGVSFVCTAVVDGRPQRVPVDVVDAQGAYQVGQPR